MEVLVFLKMRKVRECVCVVWQVGSILMSESGSHASRGRSPLLTLLESGTGSALLCMCGRKYDQKKF